MRALADKEAELNRKIKREMKKKEEASALLVGSVILNLCAADEKVFKWLDGVLQESKLGPRQKQIMGRIQGGIGGY